jgi:hypothetical protein
MSDKVVRIGGASGFWGDSMLAAPQLVRSGQIDYLVFDYLAETTMAILAAMRAKNPELGYATDFVDVAMKSVLGEVKSRGIKVVSNAGGINPRGCAAALAKLAEEAGVPLRIAVVEGDDVSALIPALRAADQRDMFNGEPLPERVLSANAYLGALPIAQALAAGADVVVTGRCVDSACTVGPLIHEFGWSAQDYDRLAGGSLAGHIIECGCQGSGGLHTDWEQVPDWPNIGYPIVECADDGSFVVTKPAGMGGLIARAAVAEQLLYEIGDPGAYLLPDVSCDFRDVRIEQLDAERVRVHGARGRAPPDSYKVSATAMDGYRCAGSMVILGIDAAAKAQRTGEAIIARTQAILPTTRLARLSQHLSRSARRRIDVRAACAHARFARGDAAGGRRSRQQAGAGNFRARDRAVGHVLGAGHDQSRRWPAIAVAADQAVRVRAGQAHAGGEFHAGWRNPCGRYSTGECRCDRRRADAATARVRGIGRGLRRGPSDSTRLGAQWRQGRPVEHRRDRAPPGVAAAAVAATHAGRGEGVFRTPDER